VVETAAAAAAVEEEEEVVVVEVQATEAAAGRSRQRCLRSHHPSQLRPLVHSSGCCACIECGFHNVRVPVG
jgi:hypothetical protein